MAFDVLAYALEFVLGPLFLLLHVPDLPAMFGEFGELAELASGGDVALVVENFVAGQYDVTGKTLTSLLGTLVWVGLIAGTVGEFGELAEMGELLEVFG